MTPKEAFEKFSPLRVANALGLQLDTVKKWHDKDHIPYYWRCKFVSLMNHHGVEITLHDLAGWIK